MLLEAIIPLEFHVENAAEGLLNEYFRFEIVDLDELRYITHERDPQKSTKISIIPWIKILSFQL